MPSASALAAGAVASSSLLFLMKKLSDSLQKLISFFFKLGFMKAYYNLYVSPDHREQCEGVCLIPKITSHCIGRLFLLN